MKIPTLIGVALIIALIGTFGLWLFYRDKPQDMLDFEVSDLQATNISDNTATIVWQTNSKATGEVLFGESENLNNHSGDSRDLGEGQERTVHFVNLKNLKPDTRYFYKIKNNSFIYPDKALVFETASVAQINELNFSFLKPIKGTILNTNLNPIDESLIFLELPGAQKLTTFSSTAGNFILPLKLVLNESLNQIFNIPQNAPATLTAKKGLLESKIKLVISDSSVNLPPITIGNNLDLSGYTQPPISIISIDQNQKVNLDFNSDGKINSLDLAILRGKAGSKNILSLEEQSQFDINSDGVVNQEDIDVFLKSLVN